MLLSDVLDDVGECVPVKGECYFDYRMGCAPGFVHYPKPGAISMRHGYLVNALRRKAMAQESYAYFFLSNLFGYYRIFVSVLF